MTILDELADYARERVAAAKIRIPNVAMRRAAEDAAAEDTGGEKRLDAALAGEGMHFICECKKASPSKGLIAPDFPYRSIAKDYEAAGADAISCLTEPKWFLGRDEYLKEIAADVSIPVLRKDFTVDPYMIWQAKTLGASAVLLIAAILDPAELAEYMEIAEGLGLSALVEAHDEREIGMALDAGATIIGVNNRDLKTFHVDTGRSANLRRLVPDRVIFVAESGIRTAEDVAALSAIGVNAVLVGEALMTSEDKRTKLAELRRAAEDTAVRRRNGENDV
ncbi:MAG: indole-3-glycerol phosphate synthase TrpC [Lachnospiraceae bacterium]|jgi:indole-3-glycerol phosphate synthase|nr:indole-3-glycerol phosphate synthase TrpC [Lachnospiraceae bacterium]MCI1328810.1 indole-3-glycerol phosphate synthase TrpC [Lachnospiraceae bacterium]